MNTHTYFFTVVVMLLASFGSLNAQQRTPVSVDTLAAREAHFLSIKLKLSAEQKLKVYHLTRQNMSGMDSVRKLPIETGGKRSTLSKLAHDYRSALKGVFSSEQYTRYEALVAEQRKRFEASSKHINELPQ